MTTITLDTKLHSEWTLYVHLSKDSDWSISSYKVVQTVDNIGNMFALLNNIPLVFYEKSMIFYMKDNIKPVWEDEHNRKGGCISFKIMSNELDMNLLFKNICYAISTNTFSTNKEYMNSINGVTISPKKNFHIIKLWLNNKDNSLISNLLDLATHTESKITKYLDYNTAIFKEHTPEY